ncbi:amidohydrolase family protein [Phenylobacterium sp.]|uniref:amidohydrolase family protein n=1 Tax=Phenylobacterium sp. TaxID=1871053 RepID=UPI002CEEABA3|nr:amidohydrolase family protein [Phenylobacterium sp.]HLZ73638.1 amidohydrolase family protein [Phenylobacterium sp.]
MSGRLTLRNVEVEGVGGLDVRLDGGRIAAIGRSLAGGGPELDGAGGGLIPGLIDHHVHLLALAAQADSIALDTAQAAADLAQRIGAAAAGRAPGAWLRATGYHERVAGVLGAAELDRLAPGHALRVQHRSGALWMLNSLALERVLGAEPPPPCVEIDEAGRPTGRIWRGDDWLRTRIGSAPPPLAPIGRVFAACGVTGLTDASATTDAAAADLLAAARRAGALPQRLMLMSAGELCAQPGVMVGPVKVLLDEHDLPDLDDLTARIGLARRWGRRVAIHCVTAVELAVSLAAFEAAGAAPGDRIEHGGLIPEAAIGSLKALGLTVVTQPGFILERGDRYLAEVAAADQDSLYRIDSLLGAGVSVAGSSDAPYSSPDPWLAIAAATARRTRLGQTVGAGEGVAPARALGLWLGGFEDPGGPPRRVAVGAAADLCLLTTPLAQALVEPDAERVAATLVGGEVVYERGSERPAA